MIKKVKGKYVVMSEKTGRKLGTYRTKAEAVKRLMQVEFFNRRKNTNRSIKKFKMPKDWWNQ